LNYTRREARPRCLPETALTGNAHHRWILRNPLDCLQAVVVREGLGP